MKLTLFQYIELITKYDCVEMDLSIFSKLKKEFIPYHDVFKSELIVGFDNTNYTKNFIIKYSKEKNQKIIIKFYFEDNILNSELNICIENNEIYIDSIYIIMNSKNYNMENYIISNIKKYKIHFKYLCIEDQIGRLDYPFKLQHIEISTCRLELFSNNTINKIKLFNKNFNKCGLDYLNFGITLYNTQMFVYDLKKSSPFDTINTIKRFFKLIKEYNKCFKKHIDYKIYHDILKTFCGNNSQDREVQFLIECDLIQLHHLMINTITNLDFFPPHEYIKTNVNKIFKLANFINDNYKIDNTKLSTFYNLLIILMKEKKHAFNNPIFLNNGMKIMTLSQRITKSINKIGTIIYDFNVYNFNKLEFLNLIYSEEIENEIQKMLYCNE